MSFLYPAFLAGLGLIAIPVIIHLFSFRRVKTVYFTNVRFLQEVKEETASKSNLKHLLVLASRVLAVAFLVLAFAQPYIPVSRGDVSDDISLVSIFIDNSFSMSAKKGDLSLLQQALAQAREIALGHSETDRFQLLTNDFEGRHQRLLSREEFLDYLLEIEISPVTRKLSEVTARQEQLLASAGTGRKKIFLLSDFQSTAVDFVGDSSFQYYLIQQKAEKVRNLFIDTVWLTAPAIQLNQPARLAVKVVNSGDENQESVRLTLALNNQNKALGELNIRAGETVVDTLVFTVNETGWHTARVSITDYPVVFDDEYFFTFQIHESVPVLVISEGAEQPYLRTLFAEEPWFLPEFMPVGNVDYSRFPGFSIIFLQNLNVPSSGLISELQNFVSAGGHLVVFPGANASLEAYNRLLTTFEVGSITDLQEGQRAVTNLEAGQELFSGVFETIKDNMSMPIALKSYNLVPGSRSYAEKILTFRDGSPFLFRSSFGRGIFYMAAIPLDKQFSDFPVHALFPPIVYRMVVLSRQTGKLCYTIGRDELIETDLVAKGSESVFRITGAGREFIPGQRVQSSRAWLSVSDQVSEAGIYTLTVDGSSESGLLSFNYNRQESVMEFETEAALKERYFSPWFQIITDVGGNFAQVIKEIDRGIILWKWCILLALLFLAIEVALLRLLPGA